MQGDLLPARAPAARADPLAAALRRRARAEGGATVRIWSAGCATGEEAYTLALLACEAYGTDAPPVRILATDISERGARQARAGEYRARSTRELDAGAAGSATSARRATGSSRRAPALACHLRTPQPRRTTRAAARRGALRPRSSAATCSSTSTPRPPSGSSASLEAALAPSGALILGAADALCGSGARLRTIVAERPVVTPPAPPRKHARALLRPLGRAFAPDMPPVPPADALKAMLQGLASLSRGRGRRGRLVTASALPGAPFRPRRVPTRPRPRGPRGCAAARRAYQQALRTFERDDVPGLHHPCSTRSTSTTYRCRPYATRRPGHRRVARSTFTVIRVRCAVSG